MYVPTFWEDILKKFLSYFSSTAEKAYTWTITGKNWNQLKQ